MPRRVTRPHTNGLVRRRLRQRRRARASRVAPYLLVGLLFFLCIGLAAATDAPGLARLLPPTLPAQAERAAAHRAAAPAPTFTPAATWTGVPTATPAPTFTPLPPPPPSPTWLPSVVPTAAPLAHFVAGSVQTTQDCTRTAVRGTIRAGNWALDGVRVRVWWPDAPPDQLWSAPSGSDPALGPGGYEVVLADEPREGWWLVAVVDESGALLSEGTVVETRAEGCDAPGGQQVVWVDFQRTVGTLGELGPTVAPRATATPTPIPSGPPAPDGQQRVLKVPILMFHYVSVPPPGSDRVRRDLSVGPDIFRAHLVTLREQGYTSITLSQLLAAIQGGAPLPDRPIVLTFDDGYRDNYTNAFAIMREEGFVGTFFVITDLVEERNAEYVTWEQLAEMQAAGMEIGSHTRHHPALPGEPWEVIWQELTGSRALLEARLGRPVPTFAYPYGRFDSGVAHLVREAGYAVAVTTKQGVTHTTGNLMSLRRIRVRGSMFPPDLMEAIHYWMVEAESEPE